MLHIKYKAGIFRLVLILIRRAEHAANKYEQGRAALVRFLKLTAKQDDCLNIYARAPSDFEECIFQADLAAGLASQFCNQVDINRSCCA